MGDFAPTRAGNYSFTDPATTRGAAHWMRASRSISELHPKNLTALLFTGFVRLCVVAMAPALGAKLTTSAEAHAEDCELEELR